MILQILLLVIFICAAYITAIPLFGKAAFLQITLPAFAIVAFTGSILFVVLSVILRLLHVSEYLIMLVPLFNLIIVRNKIRLISSKALHAKIIIHILLIIALFLNIFIQGFRMGWGSYSAEFYNVDNAAYLGLLQGFVKSATYPPLNLEIVGASFKYHYGSIAFASLISKCTLLKPHTALFIVIPTFCAGVIYSVIYKIAQKLLIVYNHYWLPVISTVITILLVNFQPGTFSPVRMYHYIFKIEMFGKDFPMLSSFTANCICLVCIYILLCASSWRDFFALLLIVPAISFFKLPYLPVVLGSISLYLVYSLITKKFLWVYWFLPMLFILSGLVVYTFSLSTNMSTITGRGTNSISFRPNAKIVTGLLVQLSFFLIPMLLIFIKRSIYKTTAVEILLCCLIVPVTTATFLKVDNADYVQIYQNAFLFWMVLIVPLALSFKYELSKFIRYFVYLNLLLPSLIIVVSLLYYTAILVKHKQQAQEYCDNRLIAGALQNIPVNGTVIVSNDLRYPANNYARADKQFQISALYGHQSYSSSYYFITKETEDVFQSGLVMERLLKQPAWNDSLNNMLHQHGITHLLINKQYLKPATIPYNMLFENEQYAVYKIE